MDNLNEELSLCVQEAKSFEIINNDVYTQAGAYLVNIKALKKKICDHHNPMIESAHRNHQIAIEQKKKMLDPLDHCEFILKNKLGAYQSECERQRRLEQERLEAEARKRQEEEALARAGNAQTEEEQEEIITRAIETVPTVLVPKVEPKLQGISRKSVWKVKIVDPKKINPEFMVPDISAIEKTARALGPSAVRVIGPGIQVYEDFIISARSK